MKGLITVGLFVGLFVMVICKTEANSQTCSNSMKEACINNEVSSKYEDMRKGCTADYSAVKGVSHSLQNYVNMHVLQSYRYLALSTLFSSYLKNREGFEKLYKKLSDEAWNDAIELTKYMCKRGLSVDIKFSKNDTENYSKANTDIPNEIQSLSVALDMHKQLAITGHNIHEIVSKRNCHSHETISAAECAHHDSGVEDYIENEFVRKHSDTVRTLAGHITDLAGMAYKKSETQLGIYLFDQYLKKIL